LGISKIRNCPGNPKPISNLDRNSQTLLIYSSLIEPDNGLDISGAPSAVAISVFAIPREQSYQADFTITAVAESNVSFNWNSYVHFNQFAGPYKFEFLLNAASTELATSLDAPDSGSFSQHVHASDIFGFKVCCLDRYAGGYGVTISNFDVTTIPEPETYAMLLGGLGLLGFMARRQKKRLTANNPRD
jgi:hypothetical protein